MTIVEAIEKVLIKKPMTALQIYNEIIKQELYVFGAKDPKGVVNRIIRMRCEGIEFPSALPIKKFYIAKQEGKKNYYSLLTEDSLKKDLHTIVNVKNNADALPEEVLINEYENYNAKLEAQLLEYIHSRQPKFFGIMVMDLLEKMGYGYGDGASLVNGKPCDGGIDGIISEDKLGLDLIYVQAKRYDPHKGSVSRNDVQAFVGAMEIVQKGVFITTAKFSVHAKDYAEKQQQKNIKLIDGKMLAKLMVDYKVGINLVRDISIYSIDESYFEE